MSTYPTTWYEEEDGYPQDGPLAGDDMDEEMSYQTADTLAAEQPHQDALERKVALHLEGRKMMQRS